MRARILCTRTLWGCRGWTWLSLALVVAIGGSVFAQQPHRLDHFKVYVVDPQQEQTTVEVKGQFDNNEFFKVNVRRLRFFANPVIKNQENDGEYFDKHAHLTWYRIRRMGNPPVRSVSVEIRNQFHKEKPLRLQLARPPVFLLVPTHKIEKDHEFPEGMDHYLAYRVIQPPNLPPKEVLLEDQWTEQAEKVRVRRPIFVCVPVSKRHDGKESKINNKRDHLTVYATNQKPKSRKVKTHDQFGDHKLDVDADVAILLCVPSHKKVIAGGPQP